MERRPFVDIIQLFDFSSVMKKSVGSFGAVILSLSAMVGSGIFVLPALAGKELYYSSGGKDLMLLYGWLTFYLAL